MPQDFMPDFDDPAFDTEAWYRRSPEDIRQAKDADAYEAWRNLSPVGMSDDERAQWAARQGAGAEDANAAGVDAAAKAPKPRPLPTVGSGARYMLDRIATAELPLAAAKGDPTGYNTQFGYGDLDPQLPKKPTTMTLDEVDAHQAKMEQARHSTAMGRYQVQRPTLQDLKTRYRLDGKAVFSPQLQDELARTIMREEGYDAYCFGQKPFHDVHQGFVGRWTSIQNDAGVSGRLNSRTGKPQQTQMTPDQFRRHLDEACRLDRAQPGTL